MDKHQKIADLQNKINELEDNTLTAEHHQCSAVKVSCRDSDKNCSFHCSTNEQEVFYRIIRLTSVRDRSCLELKKRLLAEGYDTNNVEEALNRAINCNLVNDERFADQRIRGLISKGKGVNGIEKDLAYFGIDINCLEGWPEDYFIDDSESELNRALALLNTKPSKAKNKFKGNYSKLIRFGYSTDISMRATKIYCNNNL